MLFPEIPGLSWSEIAAELLEEDFLRKALHPIGLQRWFDRSQHDVLHKTELLPGYPVRFFAHFFQYPVLEVMQ